MAQNKDSYAGPRSSNEYNRLRLQHEFIKYTMRGKLVLAPLDTESSSLQVLDSATGDGYWLVDLAKSLKPTVKLVGADIAPQHFNPPAELPSCVDLVTHDIFDEWPEEYRDRFDLVHQRFVFMICNDEKSLRALRNLFATVKPGGWIQLHDGDMDTIEEGEGHQAMEQFRDVVRSGWKCLGFNLSPGPKLVGWLKEVGAEDVHEEILTIQCGHSSPDKAEGDKVLAMLVASLDNMKGLVGKMPGFQYSTEQLAELQENLGKELRETGNSYHTHVVWARRPS